MYCSALVQQVQTVSVDETWSRGVCAELSYSSVRAFRIMATCLLMIRGVFKPQLGKIV